MIVYDSLKKIFFRRKLSYLQDSKFTFIDFHFVHFQLMGLFFARSFVTYMLISLGQKIRIKLSKNWEPILLS